RDVEVVVDGLGLLLRVLLAQLGFLLTRALERVVLVLPVEQRADAEDRDEQHREHEELRQERPVADLAEAQVAEVVEAHALPPFAPARTGGAAGDSRFTSKLSVNSLTFWSALRLLVPGIGTSCVCTRSGLVIQGELSMLRISVDTRAFDCA